MDNVIVNTIDEFEDITYRYLLKEFKWALLKSFNINDYDKLADEKVSAEECTSCGTCIEHCTQQIEIPEKLKEVCEHFEKGFSPYSRT